MADGLLDDPLSRELIGVASDQGLDLAAGLAGGAAALRPTEIAQPALLLVECVLGGLLPANLEGVAVAGHSVGEYAAAVAAGALDAGDAMRLVISRGRAMAAMREGTMCALLGVADAAAGEICAAAQRETGEVVVVANFNAPGQVVISGSVAGVEAATRRAADHGLRKAIPLNVSGAFHSPLMSGAAAGVARALDATEFRRPRVPLVSNVDAAAVSDVDGVRDRLRTQLTSPVRWVDCVRRLVTLGADVLVEVGPGTVLSGLARRIVPDVRTLSVATPEAARAALQAVGAAS
jgi:[acyl-carrier-protein] S-malonyltransferase